MPTRYFLALDQGGHASRAIVFDEAGRVVARAERRVVPRVPTPDRLEYDAEALFRSVHEVAREALANAPGRVEAAALATQRSNVACWDRETGRPLAPVLGWQDRRGAAYLKTLWPLSGEIHARTGLFLSPHYGATKLRWCLEHLSAVRSAFEAGRLAYGPMAAWIAGRLTGRFEGLADLANAQRTQLLNLDRLDWDPWLLEHFGVPGKPLPRAVPNRYEYGEAFGVPLRAVTGDQQAALFAYGEPAEDWAYANAGTGAFVLRPTPTRVAAPRLLAGLLYADGAPRYLLEGTVNGAGAALRFFAEREGIPEEALFARLPRWLKAMPAAPVVFLNGVGGLGSPYWVPDFESRFLGEGTLAERAVAVVESIVFLLVRNLEVMAAHLPPPRAIRLTGGLSRLDGFAKRLADLSGIPVHRPAAFEATARGLAFLAGGKGLDGVPEARFVPRKNPALLEAYRRFLAAMPQS